MCIVYFQGLPGRNGDHGYAGRKGEPGELIGADGLKGTRVYVRIFFCFQSIVQDDEV